MIYRVVFKPRAIKDLERLPDKDQRRVLEAIERMRDNLTGDVKKLANLTPEYRLRVGSYRVLFEVEDNEVVIYRVQQRKDVYR
ncbi:MAG: type II toxin-antitoxin system RelE/ParE family toxin [Truepera sp.]|nr:type II toxin-antitoxin system RelE/ParE family toxin [Truepera sp.]